MDKKRLIKLMLLTTSENDHEALSALRKVNLMLQKADLTWETFLELNSKQKRTVNNKKQSKPRDEFFYSSSGQVFTHFQVVQMFITLNDRNKVNDFIKSLYFSFRDRGVLSKKQVDCLINSLKNY